MKQPLFELVGEMLGVEALEKSSKCGFMDLTVTFVDPSEEDADVEEDKKKLLETVPVVRVTFPTGK